jgi:hypothetical protein
MLTPRRAHLAVLAALFLVVLAARLSNIGILWAEEAYPTAAASEVAAGKALYRDIWFDKPPLYALIYLLWGAHTGQALRIAGTLYVMLAAGLAYGFARQRWGRDEGLLAAVFLAFYLTFGIPSAVMALAPDLLLVAAHIGAVWLAWRGRPFAAGVVAGIGFAANVKGALVLVVCLLWLWRSAHRLAAGFAVVAGAMALYLEVTGAWADYLFENWTWGLAYAGTTFLDHPVREGLLRTLNWSGFQAAAVICTAWFFLRERDSASRRRMAIWLTLALASVAAGWRFFPRYYFMPLAVVSIVGARGAMLMPARVRTIVLAALLAVPAVRFGQRYASLGADLLTGRPHRWTDLAMDQDSRAAAVLVRSQARPADTLLVWGYRSEIYAYTGLRAATRYLDSQPLTGVLADRHLTSATPTAPELAARNRRELFQTKPEFIVDGLGPFQPALAIASYPDLRPWFDAYREIGRTPHAVVYRRK